MNTEVNHVTESSQIEETSRKANENTYTGSEPIFSVFMQAQVNLQTVRMTIKGRMLHQVSDLVSEVEMARREFRHTGDAQKAIADTKRIQANFEQRFQDWNRNAQTLERDKRGMSGHELQKMKAEHTRVRSSINILNRYFTKLEVELSQIAAIELTREREFKEAEANGKSSEHDASSSLSPSVPESGHEDSDADSEYPGGRVDLSIYEGLAAHRTEAFQSIREIVGEQLRMGYELASRKIQGDIGIREHAWDFGSKLCMVTRWIPARGSDWMTMHLFVWLIPKSKQIHDEMMFIKENVRFRLENNEQLYELSLMPRMPDEGSKPENKKINALIEKVLSKVPQENYSFFALHYPLKGEWSAKFQFSMVDVSGANKEAANRVAVDDEPLTR